MSAIQERCLTRVYVCLQPSAVVFCHGRLYVASTAISRNLAGFPQQGYIYEYILDGDYKVTSYKLVSSIGPLVGNSRIRTILGLACDPWDTSNDFKLYFSRSSLFRSQMDQAVVNGMTQYSVPQKVTYDGAVCSPVPRLPLRSSRCGRVPALWGLGSCTINACQCHTCPQGGACAINAC